MSKSTKRAERRHHRERLNQRTRKILLNRGWFFSPYAPNWPHTLEHYVNRRRDNMQICSCNSCRNDRRDEWCKQKLTIAEQIEDIRFAEIMSELTTFLG